MQKYFRRHIFLPQDHGSWVFILSPLLIGIFAGKTFSNATLYLVIAAMTAFLIRQPLTMVIKSYSGRRAINELPIASAWIAVYGVIIAFSALALFLDGFGFICLLAIPALPIFAWHLWLVSRREERRQIGIEIVATGVLSLSAPAAYWIGITQYDSIGWWLWLLTWMQSAASIVYAYLRLEQRGLDQVPTRSESWKMGSSAAIFISINLASSLGLGLGSLIPKWIFIPYLIQWLETIWGIAHPAVGWKPVRIGTRQLIVSIIWTALFIIFWR